MDNIQELGKWVAAGFVAILTWLGKRQISRIDRLEESCITRREFKEVMDKQHEERTKFYERTDEKLDRIHERVDTLWDRK